MEALTNILDARFTAFLSRLDRLGFAPPQVLLLEGATETERLEAALYWACRLNCEHRSDAGRPCLSCTTCQQLLAYEHLDLMLFDGRISNKQDQDQPGLVRAFNVGNIRQLKADIKVAPHGQGLRVVIFMGLDANRSEAANALLKSLEEPSATTSFVLLTAQREQLLPTLVSRSHCLTLPWPDPDQNNEQMQALVPALSEFLSSGRHFFGLTGAKGYDLEQAQTLLSLLQKLVTKALAGSLSSTDTLERSFLGLTPTDSFMIGAWLSEARQALAFQVTPSRVIEALLARLYVFLRSQQTRPRV